MRWNRFAAVAAVSVVLVGCGPAGTGGGTEGRLESDGNPLGDFQVRVFEADGNAAVAVGVTDYAGAFDLVSEDASEAVELPAGRYRATVEAIGSAVAVPDEYVDLATTPLMADYDGSGLLSFNIPGLQPPQ